MSDLGTYQMLWDCKYCGTPKLLGLNHRHCPNCGSAQDEDARYFPDDADKVAVEDHEFVGADLDCPRCSSPMSAKAAHCTNCGVNLAGAQQVTKVDERPPPKAAPPPPKRGKGRWIGVVALILLAVLVLVFWKQDVAVEATGHRWERTVVVERYGPQTQSAWCDSMPRDAYNVSRSREVRDHRQIPDGQTCTTARRDNGDGTFTEYQDCQPKYRSEPIYDDKCRFQVDRWAKARTAEASGGLTDPVVWPDPKLARTGTCRGCEREGKRREAFSVVFRRDDGKDFACPFPQAEWKQIAVGAAFTTKEGVVVGGPSCGKLQPR